MLLRVMFLLLSFFAVLSASVASAHTAHASNHELRASDSAGPADEQQTLFLGDETLALAECSGDGFDESSAPEAAYGYLASSIGKSTLPAFPLFDFLRVRTCAPRAPPAVS
ncbi:hypothetical protein [Aminobacter sp. HY435]|uniref:hypothetical protein n=1 Tax=Aminobacter sp. HY435 TaxID=2970917 RepID=UPI0022B9656D|nr:hypothetical protein [Aminobacter sp. HY435]